MMRIHAPEIVRHQDSVALRAPIEFAGRREQLWYSVAPGWEGYLTPERCDAFVVALLPVAMHVREDLHVAGTISERLYYNLVNYYTKILTIVIPSLRHVGILPERIESGPLPRERVGVGTGFSGGIDSFCVLADHFYAPVPDTFRVTHLLFNNVGSHGHGEEARALCARRFQRLLPTTQALGLPFLKVDSNLDDLFPPSLGFQLTHTSRNISAALALQRLIGRYYYASSYRYEDCFVGRSYGAGFSDPVAVHLLSTENMDCISTGGQYSRVEKTLRITEIPQSYGVLDVCVGPLEGRNCSRCWKCARTLLTLEILGKLELYDRVFDLSAYRQIRRDFLCAVSRGKDPYQREILHLAQERGYPLPLFPAGYRLKQVAVAAAGKVVKRVTGRWNTGLKSAPPGRKARAGC